MRQFALLSGGKCQTSSWFTTRKTFYDTPRLLHIEQPKKWQQHGFFAEEISLWWLSDPQSSQLKWPRGGVRWWWCGGAGGVVRRGCRGANNSARGLDAEAISAQNQHHPARVQSLGASAAASGRAAAHVLHKWFRRQRGGSEQENKFITLPCLHILLPKGPSMRTAEKWAGLILDSESYWMEPRG